MNLVLNGADADLAISDQQILVGCRSLHLRATTLFEAEMIRARVVKPHNDLRDHELNGSRQHWRAGVAFDGLRQPPASHHLRASREIFDRQHQIGGERLTLGGSAFDHYPWSR